MNKLYKFFLVFIMLTSLLFLTGCEFLDGREYNEDINIEIEEGELIIREWSFLQGSGAEVYYFDGKDEILLGQIQVGDDGYCPFKEGNYSVSYTFDSVTLRWHYASNDIFHEKTFSLPE